MNKIALATIAGALAIVATPASAQHYGHGHGYKHYAHVQHHSHHSYGHSYHKPTYTHGYVHHQPSYHTPHYAKPVYVQPTVSYEKRPAYVYQKVAGYCVDVVKSYGYNQHRKTVECKAGEYQKPEHKTEQPAPAPEQPAEEADRKSVV